MTVQLKGYVRCSTKEQSPDRQIIALREFGVPEDSIVIEMLSGKNFQRPAYQEMVMQLKPGDALVIDSLDRLGRDRNAVVDEWRRITKEMGADIVVMDMLPLLDTRHKEQDITASFVADLVLQVLCYVCEKERLLNHERASAGIAAAKARGVRFGRKPIEKPAEFEAIRELWESGEISASAAARRLGVSRPTFMTWVGK
ncbi:MAG: recombinase family protein [Defluviitaleaceae bacterium]|nr:recombinase family protein [Defluviitaleaceae bacterium]